MSDHDPQPIHRAALTAALTALLALTSACGYWSRSRSPSDRIRSSVVRVVTRTGAGTGFFVKGPDGHSYVVTAFHVIENGSPLSLFRYVDVGKAEHYVEAYPEVDVVAYDREADLAVLRARNVPDRKMPALSLAEPSTDEPVRSYGFPASSLVASLGLTVKDGKVLDVVQLPVVDRRTRRLVKQNAIAGIIVSSALEPGFSGGPTTNQRGEVVGVNVQKDAAFHAQNGAVHAAVVRKLLARVGPEAAPTPSDVAALLDDLQTTVLRLPVTERFNLVESDVLSLVELAALRKYSDALWWSTESAGVRLALSLMPGKTLETSSSPEVLDRIHRCRQNITPLKTSGGIKKVDVASECGEIPLRPLAWDLVASTLHWDGRQHKYVVGGIEQVDPVQRHYVAKVALEDDADTFFALPLVAEGGRLKVRLFDDETPLALDSASKWSAGDFAGTWYVATHKVERARKSEPSGTTFSSGETLTVSISADGRTRVTHDVQSARVAPEGETWDCNRQSTVGVTLHQELVGNYANGAVRTLNESYDEQIKQSTCVKACSFCGTYQPDKFAFFKRLGNQLVMYRSDGHGVEQQVFTRSSS